MQRDKMLEARQMIIDKRYAEARRILEAVDHPTAKAWLQKLDDLEQFPGKVIPPTPVSPATPSEPLKVVPVEPENKDRRTRRPRTGLLLGIATLVIVLGVGITVVLHSRGSRPSDPTSVVQAFLAAAQAGDGPTINSLITDQFKAMLTLMYADPGQAAAKEMVGVSQSKVLTSEISASTANESAVIVQMQRQINGQDGEVCERYDLLMVDGTWRIGQIQTLASCDPGAALAVFGGTSTLTATPLVLPYQQLPQSVTVDGAPILGDSSAKVSMLEFADFSAPHGLEYQPTIRAVIDQWVRTKKLRLIYQPVAYVGGQFSEMAAEGALCAGKQGHFWEMVDALFTVQETRGYQAFSAATIKGIADSLQINGDQVASCINSGETAVIVTKSAAYGDKLGVTGTPAILFSTDGLTYHFLTGSGGQPILPTIDDISHEVASTSEGSEASPTMSSPSSVASPTLDSTELAVAQTSTRLAQTSEALSQAPTLTMAVLAPGLTQTAVVAEQDGLNTAIVATQTAGVLQTQIVATATQAALNSLLTQTMAAKTSVAQTQVVLGASQTSAALTGTLHGHIVFITHSRIYRLSLPDLTMIPLSDPSTRVDQAVGSPDGKSIAYVANYQIFVMSADGSHPQDLTAAFKNRAVAPAWSPDGKRIAFSGGSIGKIWLMDANGTNFVRLTNDQNSDSNPAWSPDGKRIAYTLHVPGNTQIALMDADGKNSHLLTPGLNPSWSQDGKTLLYESGDSPGDQGVYVINADGTRRTRLTDTHKLAASPTWSPDGQAIAFAAPSFGQGWQLYAMPADGSFAVQLTTTVDNTSTLSWTP